MKCPACGHEMTEVTVEAVTLDVCRGGCGGIWFDRFELQKVDEQHEAAGERLLFVERNSAVRPNPTEQRRCPRCDIPMTKNFASSKFEIEVDECYGCGGTWLDAGELRAIREQYKTDAERTAASQAYFEEVFKEKLEVLRGKGERDAARAERLSRMFRFICPSFYLSALRGEPWYPGR